MSIDLKKELNKRNPKTDVYKYDRRKCHECNSNNGRNGCKGMGLCVEYLNSKLLKRNKNESNN